MHRDHVYIVDDDPSFGKSLKRLLNANGFSAECFGSAQCFLDSVPHSQEGIAIIDIHMPECDGFELIDRMRDMGYAMRVILVTGQTQAESRATAMQKGAIGFIQKPFGEPSVLEMIARANDR